MNALEDRLHDAFRAEADTVRPGTIPPAPARRAEPVRSLRTSRRARALIPLAAAVAVLALVTGLSLARPQLLPGGNPRPATAGPSPSLHLPSPRNQPPASQVPVPQPVLAANASRGVPASAPAPGVPRFYVTVTIGTGPGATPNTLLVRSTATGRVTGQIEPPDNNADFAAVAAPAGDRTFVTAVEAGTGCTSQLYQFRLDKQGAPGPLVPLHITVPGTYAETGDLAVTPGGSTIAFATYLCDGHGELGVIDLATRHVAVWSNRSVTTPAGLSLSADGGLLLYDVPGVSPEARILNTAAPAGSLPERSRVVSTTAAWTALAGNGDSLYGCAVSPSTGPAPSRGAVTYYTRSLAGGQQHVVASWPDLPYPQCWASLDPSQGYLLVQYPANVPGHTDWVRPAILDVHSGRLSYIADPAFYGFLDIAW